MNNSSEQALADAYNRGLELEKAGDADGAAKAYAEALALDPADHGGVSVRLAALRRAAVPDRAPPAYVATLFDQHAEAFDDILVGQLSYRTPQDMREALTGRFPRLLDLGCGTGLVAAALIDITDHRTGVDLAEAMLEIADERELYDDLYTGDAEGFLEAAAEEGETWDLIAAADVLPYLGDVASLFGRAAERLNPGGALIFSTESAEASAFDRVGWTVGPKHRFAHAEAYLRETLAAAGLMVENIVPITVRTDDGEPVPGQLVTARKPG